MAQETRCPWYPDTTWNELSPFYAGLRAGELSFPRCTHCERFQWYPQELCPRCGTPSLAWTAVTPVGTIYSWTVVRRPFLPEYASVMPATIGLIRLEDAPNVNLVANVIGADDRDLEIGEEVRIEFDDVGNDVTLPVAVVGGRPSFPVA